MYKKIGISGFSFLFILFLVLSIMNTFMFGFPNKIGGVVAVVNNEVITLTDLRIVKAFGLYDLKNGVPDHSLYQTVLENMISQKLVHQFTGNDININKEEMDGFLEDLEERFEDSGWKEKLSAFGMTTADLRDYCAQYLCYKKTVLERFRRSVVVSLKEIEEYYNQVYVPEQEAQGETIEQMVDILPEIESAVKERITKVQAEEWIENLKSQAEIRVRLDQYIDFLHEKNDRVKSSESLSPQYSIFYEGKRK
jgi:DNA-binding transcriptional MerR regulator